MVQDAEDGLIQLHGRLTPSERHNALADGVDEEARQLQSALVIAAGAGRVINQRWLGRWLSLEVNKIVDGLRLRSMYNSHRKLNLWYVEPYGREADK